jgi:ATP-dependent DNA helicase 2 subunit 2
MFLVDISPSMGKLRSIELPGNEGSIEITHLEWALQFVKLKVQEMVRASRNLTEEGSEVYIFVLQIFDGRKTDKCGVITFGSEGTLSFPFFFMVPMQIYQKIPTML